MRIPSTVITCLSGFLLTLGATVSWAEESTPWILAKYDLNGDEKITQAEVSQKKQLLFSRMDANQDGDITFQEYQTTDQKRREALLKARFGKLDDNHDGQVSEKEYASFLGMFNSFDSDGDGTLSEAEVGLQTHSETQITRCLLWFCLRTDLN